MIPYLATTAGGMTIHINGAADGAGRIEREFSLLFGEAVTVKRETR